MKYSSFYHSPFSQQTNHAWVEKNSLKVIS